MDAVKCSNCPQETRREALQHLMKKPAGGKVALIVAVTSGDDEGSNASSSSLLVVESGAVAPVRKRKKTTLDGFMDHPLNDDQKARTDIKLLQFFIHANIPFYAGGDFYFHQFLNEIWPSYTTPTRYVLSHSLLNSEAARVKLEEVDRLKGRRLLTLLLDGWEDKLRRSLYGSLAAEVKQHPIILALEDMMGVRGTVDNLMAMLEKAMKAMEIGDGKKIVAATTNNPTVMQSFRQKFQTKFYWVLTFACFLHSMNTLLGPEAQRRVNGQTPVAADVIKTVIHTPNYWNYLDQMVRTTKFIVNTIGNIENRDCNLAECMLELICCAHKMSTLQLDDGDDSTFFTHAKSVFNCRFHSINTKYHTLALFLHPMCHKLAVTQAASGCPFEFMVKVALEVALQWKWSKAKADVLVMDLKAYNLCHSPFARGQADGLAWWENLPINSEMHPLKAFAIIILSIVPHTAEVERLFLDLGIDTDVAKQLETDFAFVPPLAAVSGDTNCNLEGPESISLDDIDAEFAWLEDIRKAEKMIDTEFLSDWDVDGREVLEGNAFDFAELQCVDEGLVPAAVEDEIMVTDHDVNEDGTWNIDSMLLSSGLTSM
ncbi:uncharacterized protein BJ212DRAFT_1303393 [Suillus subaureus]|uniref:DUF659 domain-containing protein n=1 Tax=Suillus subaureus TaxID=48587 RepID=A0A9P7E054_9AGAM|nr:uncharacterized protein BJ212DRAFT_1303393 [Suillus subaureus]KAG1807686.1 hypothetical protein BJ212DRAFT_1303393 [Suillus subaureus]